MVLDELKKGDCAQIVGVLEHAAHSEMASRLAQLGFIEGEPVTLLRRGPVGREPLAVQIGNTIFALKQIEAQQIMIEKSKKGT